MTDKKTIDYSHGKIYGIRSRSSDLVYIGSTIQPLSKRLASHVGNYKHWLKCNVRYVTSYKLIELGDYYIELIEEVNCSSKEQLLAHEGRHIRNIECVNRRIPGRTTQEHKEIARKRDSEYYQDNKLYIIERADDYYRANKETIRAKLGEVLTCECGQTYTRGNKLQHYKSKKHLTWLS